MNHYIKSTHLTIFSICTYSLRRQFHVTYLFAHQNSWDNMPVHFLKILDYIWVYIGCKYNFFLAIRISIFNLEWISREIPDDNATNATIKSNFPRGKSYRPIFCHVTLFMYYSSDGTFNVYIKGKTCAVVWLFYTMVKFPFSPQIIDGYQSGGMRLLWD